ncbi:hypothetical protein, partial [Caballeronia grimmiae]|uniref:hypothetical protein n=1 Tax=Caballeronia grimmiae TaxID=1071679 RepID=UPI0038B7CC24
ISGLLNNRTSLGALAALVMRAGAAVRMLALRASMSNVSNAKQRYDDSNDFFIDSPSCRSSAQCAPAVTM